MPKSCSTFHLERMLMISDNIKILQNEITQATLKAGRKFDTVKLIAVSKRFPVEAITQAFSCGQRLFGENYIQEVQTKRGLIPEQAQIHFIGHLQTNKAKIAAETCSMVETVDRIKLGVALNRHLLALEKVMDILVQINIGNDPAKSGITEEETIELLTELNKLPQIRVCGLMTMPPFEENPELSRPYFKNLRLLAEKMTKQGYFPDVSAPELSMGMSNDFHIAIEEGSTIVRVGTAIFGQRPALKK